MADRTIMSNLWFDLPACVVNYEYSLAGTTCTTTPLYSRIGYAVVRRWRWRPTSLKPPLALILRKDPCQWRFRRNWKRHLRDVRSEKGLVPIMISSQERTSYRTWRSGASLIPGRARRNATSPAYVGNDRLPIISPESQTRSESRLLLLRQNIQIQLRLRPGVLVSAAVPRMPASDRNVCRAAICSSIGRN